MQFRLVARVLFPAAALSTAALAAPSAAADEISDAVEGAAEERTTELENARFASPAALCRGYLAWATAARASGPPSHDESIVAHTPRCFVESTPLAFAGTRSWKSLRVAHVDDGVGKASRLVVETPSGWLLTPMSWNEEDPRDPGCPSFVRDISVDGAAVQHGRLVVIMAGERTTYVEPTSENDSGARAELVRTPYWASEVDGVVTFKSTQAFLVGGTLGSKVQPAAGPGRWVAWTSIPWSGFRAFHLDPNGAVRVVPDGKID